MGKLVLYEEFNKRFRLEGLAKSGCQYRIDPKAHS